MAHMKGKEISNLLYEASAVMGIKRTGWELIAENKVENVGQHTAVTSVGAYFLAKEVEKRTPVNLEEVMVMSAIHDFHEARTGEHHKVSKKYVQRDQDLANEDIFAEISPWILQIVNKYEAKDSVEAHVVFDANLIAFIIELKKLHEQSHPIAERLIVDTRKKLFLLESQEIVEALLQSNSYDWWLK